MTPRFLSKEEIESTFIEAEENWGSRNRVEEEEMKSSFCSCYVWNALAIKWSEIVSWIHESGLQKRGPDQRNKFGSQKKSEQMCQLMLTDWVK